MTDIEGNFEYMMGWVARCARGKRMTSACANRRGREGPAAFGAARRQCVCASVKSRRWPLGLFESSPSAWVLSFALRGGRACGACIVERMPGKKKMGVMMTGDGVLWPSGSDKKRRTTPGEVTKYPNA